MIFKILANYGPLLLAAMGQTLLLALWSLFFACLIGLFVGILSVLKSRVCNIIATIFVDIIRGVPMIVLETAQPAKFEETIREALGTEPVRPAELKGIEALEQRVVVMDPDVNAIKQFVVERV